MTEKMNSSLSAPAFTAFCDYLFPYEENTYQDRPQHPKIIYYFSKNKKCVFLRGNDTSSQEKNISGVL